MVLSLKYEDLSAAISESNKLANELGQYCDELSRKVQQKMYSVEGGMSSALNSVDYYVNQKISQLRTREANAQDLASKSQTLLDTAKRVDEDVEKTIQANQAAFFNKNPELRPPSAQEKVFAFLTGLGNAAGNGAKALGALIGEGINALGQALAPLAELGRNIRKWWEEGGWKVVVTVGVGVLVSAALIASGGTLAILGGGLLGGLISQTMGDIFSGKTSSWQSYVFSGAGGALGALFDPAFANAASNLAANVWKLYTGESEGSLIEITAEVIIDSVIGAVVGNVVGKFIEKLPKTGFIGKIFKAMRLEGRTSYATHVKIQFRKLMTGSTKNIHWKTIRNIMISNAWDSFKETIKSHAVKTAKKFVKDSFVRPLVDYAKGTEWLDPIFRRRIEYPTQMKEGMDLVKNMFDIYQSLPQLKAA